MDKNRKTNEVTTSVYCCSFTYDFQVSIFFRTAKIHYFLKILLQEFYFGKPNFERLLQHNKTDNESKLFRIPSQKMIITRKNK